MPACDCSMRARRVQGARTRPAISRAHSCTVFNACTPPSKNQADLRAAIPAECWEKNTFKSMAYLALDVGIVAALAIGALTVNAW